jgi:glycosyltransferase involved in cell wall biosynthesis
MKILIVNTFDREGGASKAAYRLFDALNDAGEECYMLVQKKTLPDNKIFTPAGRMEKILFSFRNRLEQIPLKMYKKETKTPFSTAWVGNPKIKEMIDNINPDIVHLHWINGSMLKVEDLIEIKKPIVWTLHDMWAFTGGCHYDEGCGAYNDVCSKCKILHSNYENDLSRKIFERKRKIYEKLDLTIVGLSKWITECSKNSTLLKKKNHINLPNPINTNIFKPLNKKNLRNLWNLPNDKKLVLFGMAGAENDTRKGYHFLLEAIKKLNREKIELVSFGSSIYPKQKIPGYKIHHMGILHDDISLVTLYNCADVTVVPSLQENLSNMIMESLACGTPVVAFDIGGNGDMVEHHINGYLAKAYDIKNLAEGIEWIIYHKNYEAFCHNAREKTLNEFSYKIVAKKYIKLYKDILDERK